jgi:uncharacterized protein (DUF2062 family)
LYGGVEVGFLHRILNLDDSPERIASGFALGVFWAFSPLVGLHTFLGLAIASLFRLNRVAVLFGLFINNPWTLVPIYTVATYLGSLLIGFPPTTNLPHFEFHLLWSFGYWVQLVHQWRILKPLLLGSIILSITSAVLSYPFALYLIRHGKISRIKA